MYKGVFANKKDDWDGYLLIISAPIVILTHLIISIVLELRKVSFASDYYACGSIFLIFSALILANALFGINGI